MFKLLILLSFFTGIALYIPYQTGIEAEKRLTSFNLPFTNVEKLDNNHQRGWFSSQVKSDFLLQHADKNVPIHLQHQIEHGLLPIKPTVIHTQIDLPQSQQQLMSLFGDATSIKLKTTIRATNQHTTVIEIPASSQPITLRNMQWQWQAATSEIHFSSNLSQLKNRFVIPNLEIKTPKRTLHLKDLSINLFLSPVNQKIMIKEGKITIASLNSETVQGVKTQLQQINLQFKNQFDKEYFDIKTTLQVNKGHVDGVPYHGEGKIDVNHLHLFHFQTGLIKLGKSLFAPQAQRQLRAATALFQHGLPVLNSKPALAITQTELMTEDGKINFNGQVVLNPLQAYMLFDPATHLVNQLDGQVQIDLSQQFVEKEEENNQLDKLIPAKTWLKEGWLKPATTSHYTMQLQLQNGQIIIN